MNDGRLDDSLFGDGQRGNDDAEGRSRGGDRDHPADGQWTTADRLAAAHGGGEAADAADGTSADPDDDHRAHDVAAVHDGGVHDGGAYDRAHDGGDADEPGAHLAEPPGGGRGRLPRGWLLIAAALVVVLGGVGVAVAVVRPIVGHFTAAKDYPGPGSGSVDVVVNPGDSGAQIGQTLQQDGVVLTSQAFVDALSASQGPEIQPGHYTLRKEMSAAEAVDALRQGSRNVKRVTVREGMWKSEVFAELSKVTGTPLKDYQELDAKIRANPDLVGLPDSAKGNVEGYLYPATYSFDPGTSALAQIREMVAHTTHELRALGVQPANMERIVIIASIVEAEARLDADRPKVARVIDNRIARPMRLQLDSTVSYGVQKRTITTSDQARAANNGYNTYVKDGLPIGPIGNPGAASIKAAQQPAPGPWLYFVTVDPETGETRFATTQAEHDANVRLFQQWCQGHPGKC